MSFETLNIPIVHPPEGGQGISAYSISNWQARYLDKDQV
jgi:hypothetical protein